MGLSVGATQPVLCKILCKTDDVREEVLGAD